MICKSCRKDRHASCPGGTWCDCQHRKSGVNWPLVRKPDVQVADPTTRPVDCLKWTYRGKLV
jgi:hypothetical protein